MVGAQERLELGPLGGGCWGPPREPPVDLDGARIDEYGIRFAPHG